MGSTDSDSASESELLKAVEPNANSDAEWGRGWEIRSGAIRRGTNGREENCMGSDAIRNADSEGLRRERECMGSDAIRNADSEGLRREKECMGSDEIRNADSEGSLVQWC